MFTTLFNAGCRPSRTLAGRVLFGIALSATLSLTPGHRAFGQDATSTTAQAADGEGAWPAGNATALLYRTTTDSLGDRNGVSLWVRGDGTAVNLRVRLMTVDAANVTPDTVMDRPMWISKPILVKSTEWRKVVLSRSDFTLHRLNDAPDGFDPDLPPDAQIGVTPQAEDVKFADVNAVALEANVPWHSTIAVDDISFVTVDDSGAASNPAVVDDFETGNVAAWNPVGDRDELANLDYGVITKAGWFHGGRVAFKMDVIAPAARRKSILLPGVTREMTVSHLPYVVFIPKSTFETILPSSLPDAVAASSSVSVQLCPDQVQAASFCLYSRKALSNVSVSLDDDLHGAGHVLGRGNVDLEVVKVWNRNGSGVTANADNAGPRPELLVKDDRISLSGLSPTMRITGDPATDIPADTTKQFWITVTAPRNAQADNYTGHITVKAGDGTTIRVPISVTVLALRLLSPAKQYAIDLRSRLDSAPDSVPATDGSAFVTDYVSADILNKQLTDIAAHGLHYISIHDSDSSAWDAYNARKTAGFMQPFVYQGPSDPAQIEKERNSHSADPFLYYADPTSTGESQIQSLSAKGLPMATYIDHQSEYDTLENGLDTAIYSTDESYSQQLIRTHGKRVSSKHDWWYWFAANSDPFVNRCYAGFMLQRASLYGAFIPTYQLSFGTDPYDDSSQGAPRLFPNYRPEMLTYPVAGGVLDTLQWEAVREGISDERYLTTFYAALRECKDAQKAFKDSNIPTAYTGEAEAYVTAFMDKPLALLSGADYDTARAKISDYALHLRTMVDKCNKAHHVD